MWYIDAQLPRGVVELCEARARGRADGAHACMVGWSVRRVIPGTTTNLLVFRVFLECENKRVENLNFFARAGRARCVVISE